MSDGYSELQETISYLVAENERLKEDSHLLADPELVLENKRLKGSNCELVDLLSSLAYYSEEMIRDHINGNLTNSQIEDVRFVIKQIPDAIR